MKKVINKYGKEIDYEAALILMDDEICDQLYFELAPCTEQEFFDLYSEFHLIKYGEEWELAKENPVW